MKTPVQWSRAARAFALVCLVLFVAMLQAPLARATAGYMTVSSSSLLSGVSNATISWQAVNNSDVALPGYRIGASAGGQWGFPVITASVTSGAFSIVVADTYLTSPQNVCYDVQVTDNATGNVLLHYTCVQPASSGQTSWCASSTCNFDNYIPSLPGLNVATTGPAGPAGAPGAGYIAGLASDGANGIAVTGKVSAPTVTVTGTPVNPTDAVTVSYVSSLTPTSTNINSGLVGYWRFDEGAAPGIYSDLFNYANGALPSPWVSAPTGSRTLYAGTVTSHTVYETSTGAYANYYNVALPANQFSQVSIGAASGSGSAGTTVRQSTSADTRYDTVVTGTNQIYVEKVLAGTVTQFTGSPFTQAWSVGDVLFLSASGTSTTTLTVKIFHSRSWVTVATVTDSSSPITSGYAGLTGYGAATPPTIASWAGGPLSALPVPETDFSGNNNMGAWTGSSAYSTGKVGPYSGSIVGSDYVSVADATDLDFGTGSFSFALWFQASQNRGVQPAILSKWTPSVGFTLYITNAGLLNFYLEDSATHILQLTTTAAYDDGAWHHVAGVRNAATHTMALYVDGLLGTVVPDTTVNLTASAALMIGNQAGGSPFTGLVDDVRVYGRSLSSAEAQVLAFGQPGIYNVAKEPTPSMGWNPWQIYGAGATQAEIQANCAAMATNGMLSAGYNYCSVDDGWSTTRTDGVLTPNSNFTSMAALGTYIHGLGELYAHYIAPGTSSGCASQTTSGGYEMRDAALLASWGVDYVKGDSCWTGWTTQSAMGEFATLEQAFIATNRPMRWFVSDPAYFCSPSTCAYSWTWFAGVGGNEDWSENDLSSSVGACGSVLYGINWAALGTAVDSQYGLASYAGPGHFLFPGIQLGVGNGCLTDTEGQSDMSLMAILAAPLFASIDLTAPPSSTTLATLTNSDVIAVDQDALGFEGARVSQVACGSANCEVYARQLSGGAWAVLLWNRDSASHSISASWSMFGQTGPFTTTRDLWVHSSLGTLASGYTATVPSHGVAMIRVAP